MNFKVFIRQILKEEIIEISRWIYGSNTGAYISHNTPGECLSLEPPCLVNTPPVCQTFRYKSFKSSSPNRWLPDDITMTSSGYRLSITDHDEYFEFSQAWWHISYFQQTLSQNKQAVSNWSIQQVYGDVNKMSWRFINTSVCLNMSTHEYRNILFCDTV